MAVPTVAHAAGTYVFDWTQSANNDGKPYTLGEIHWIGSILQASNSVYFEGMATAQRLFVYNIPTSTVTHTLVIDVQTTKSGGHAYDFMVGYDQFVALGNTYGLPFLGTAAAPTASPFSQAVLSGDVIDNAALNQLLAPGMLPTGGYYGGGTFADFPIPGDPHVTQLTSTGATCTIQSKIDMFTTAYGVRNMRVWTDGIAKPVLQDFTVEHIDANGTPVPDGQDGSGDYLRYTLTFTGHFTKFFTVFGGHIALSSGQMGYGTGFGAAAINGGPYHFKIAGFDGNGGSQDNQLQGASILIPGYKLSGFKFHDQNADSIWEKAPIGTEPGLGGWTIYIDANNNGVLDSSETSTLTAGDGSWSFTNIPAGGPYIIREVIPLGSSWISSFPTATVDAHGPFQSVSVTTTDVTGIDFGNYQPATKNGTKFEDLNANGVKDSGEPGLSGWKILAMQGTTVVASATTDVNGAYSMSLKPGDYVFQEDFTGHTGWTCSMPGVSGAYASETVTSGTTYTNNFGNWRYATKSGTKFEDLNANGVKGSGEPGVGGVTITATALGQTPTSTTTAADGTYSLSLKPGIDWTVAETVPAGWLQSYPAAPGTYTVNLNSGATHANNDFGNYRMVTLTVHKYHDLNANGADNSEPVLSGWYFWVDVNKDGVFNAGDLRNFTDSSGNATFSVKPGIAYPVHEETQTAWINSDPGGLAPVKDSVLITSGVTPPVIEFGNYQNVTVSVFKYLDKNADGTFNGSDTALAGWEFFADLNHNGSWDSGEPTATTNASGIAAFSLTPGSAYDIVEVLQAGWINSQPGGTAPFKRTTATLVSGTTPPQLNFGNYQNVVLTVHKYNDLNADGALNGGEPGLSGWYFWVDVNGNHTYDSGTDLRGSADGSGDVTFTVKPGQTYDAYEELQATWINSDPGGTAPFKKTSDTIVSGVTPGVLNFGNYQMATKTGMKFEDLDANGSKGTTEPGIAGVTITASAAGQSSVTTTTRSDGTYTLYLKPGIDWTVAETVPAGYVQSYPGGSGTWLVNLSSGEVDSGNDFGNYRMVTVSVLKYHDLNADGARDGGEPALAGWGFFVDLNHNGSWNAGEPQATTNGSGVATFSLKPGSTYDIVESLTAGWINSQPGGTAPFKQTTATLVSGVTPPQLVFGNYQNVVLTVHKYHDLNANGHDNSEPGLSGWYFWVDVNGNHTYDSGTDLRGSTDGSGDVTFTVKPGQTYDVYEELQATWINSDPGGTASFKKTSDTIVSGVTPGVLNFGNYQNVTVSVFKYWDKDANGSYSASVDTSLTGWVFWADLNGNGTEDAGEPEATTDANGIATFSLKPGAAYNIYEKLQAGWVCSDPGGTAPFSKSTGTLTSGVTASRISFGNFQNVTLTIHKYHDLNANGADNSEPGLSGWYFWVDVNTNGVFDAGDLRSFTDSSGNATFSVKPGIAYPVHEETQTAWINSDPGGLAPVKNSVLITSGVTPPVIEFGNYQNVTVSVFKYHDRDASADYNAAIDTPLSGWEFFVDLNHNNAWDSGEPTATTNTGGIATFSLQPGSAYDILEVLQPDWICSDPGAGLEKTTPTLVSGTTPDQLKFGNYQMATKYGTKFHDLDADGVKDPGEPGLSGWKIEAVQGASVVNSATTDGSGNYSMLLKPGTYVFREVFSGHSGWYCSKPGPSGEYAPELFASQDTTRNDFGNYQLASKSGMKFHDLNANGVKDSGEPGLAGWTINLYDSGNHLVESTTTASDGSYLFNDIMPGRNFYVVEQAKANWPQTFPTVDTSTPIFAYSGTSHRVAYLINLTSGESETGNDFGNATLSIEITKTISDTAGGPYEKSVTVLPGTPIFYRYVVTNTGEVPLFVDHVTDDNRTPGTISDDFDIHIGQTLASGESTTVYAPLSLNLTATFTITGEINTAVVSGSFDDAAGDTYTATAQDTARYYRATWGATRTVGFWQTHGFFVDDLLDHNGNTMDLGWIDLPLAGGTGTDPVLDQVLAVLNSNNPKVYKPNTKPIGDQNKLMDTTRQLAAAILNNEMGAAVPTLAWPQPSGSQESIIVIARDILSGYPSTYSIADVVWIGSQLESYNVSGDSIALKNPPTGWNSTSSVNYLQAAQKGWPQIWNVLQGMPTGK